MTLAFADSKMLDKHGVFSSMTMSLSPTNKLKGCHPEKWHSHLFRILVSTNSSKESNHSYKVCIEKISNRAFHELDSDY